MASERHTAAFWRVVVIQTSAGPGMTFVDAKAVGPGPGLGPSPGMLEYAEDLLEYLGDLEDAVKALTIGRLCWSCHTATPEWAAQEAKTQALMDRIQERKKAG